MVDAIKFTTNVTIGTNGNITISIQPVIYMTVGVESEKYLELNHVKKQNGLYKEVQQML
jgi:hypothetical protein